MKRWCLASCLPAALGMLSPAVQGQSAQSTEPAGSIEEIVVTSRPAAYNRASTTDEMSDQQAALTSALAVIDNLPGVSVQEGDTFGFDDWSTTISMRGFQVSLDEQQLGITIDGLPNGNSNYGGGAKANRYIDTQNLLGVEVSQGTADIGSPSNEALGGTLNFLTRNPADSPRARLSVALGQFEAERYYFRADTGRLFATACRAWLSLSRQEATDWVNASAENRRNHFAGKTVCDIATATQLTAYFAFDDVHEDNYQRLFSAADYAGNPEWDRLTDEWTGVPYVDQLYRKGWSTLRDNRFAYVRINSALPGGWSLEAAVYLHRNDGRGDWLPPYVADVTDDGPGNAQSELLAGRPVQGGDSSGRLYFVDAAGIALSPMPGCASSIRFPYGGAGPEYDPACHPDGAIPVQSYRHTHYAKKRLGGTAGFHWETSPGVAENRLAGGIWYEDYVRPESRDWHRISDTRAGFGFEEPAYWEQYSREYPQKTLKWQLEDRLSFGAWTAVFGIKQFLIDIRRRDHFRERPDIRVNSDSDLLFSGGLIYAGPVKGMTLFAGYAENFSTYSDDVLERPASDFGNLRPETADNFDVGLRLAAGRWDVSVAYYNIEFRNRLIFLDGETVAGPNYLIGSSGAYFNAGGITSRGFEFAASLVMGGNYFLSTSYTHNDSSYLGTGDPLVDAALGITPGNRVVNQADRMFVLSADYRGGNFFAGISAKYTDDRYIRFDNAWAAESYVLTDLYIGTSGLTAPGFASQLEARLVVNNVFDADYLAGIAGQGAWIGAPRTVTLTLTLDF